MSVRRLNSPLLLFSAYPRKIPCVSTENPFVCLQRLKKIKPSTRQFVAEQSTATHFESVVTICSLRSGLWTLLEVNQT